MRAAVMYGAGDVRIEDVPDARLIEPTDAVVRVARACICGSDLWPYNGMEPTDGGRRMGHEAIGVVEDVGADVHTMKPGDVVVMPFAFSEAAASSATTACTHRASTAASSAPVTEWTAPKRRRCGCLMPTGRCSCSRSARTTRLCPRSSRSRT
jgi:threonine dehydrogenase-like Zn-dependent dehydrogenase